MMKKQYLVQRERLIVTLISIALLFAANRLIFGSFLPAFDNKSLWFLVALLNMLLANQLFSPFYVKPIDTLSFGITAFTAVIMIKADPSWSIYSKILYYFGISFSVFIVILAVLSIVTKDSEKKKISDVGESIRLILSVIGSANVVFFNVLLFAVVTFHVTSAKEVFGILLFYILFVSENVLSACYLGISRLIGMGKTSKHLIGTGEIVAYQEPNIILVRQDREQPIPFMTCILIKDNYSEPKLGYSLDFVGQLDGVLLRTFITEVTENKDIIRDARALPMNSVAFLDKDYFKAHAVRVVDSEIIGLVACDTSIDYLNFEIVKDVDILIGSLVETKIHECRVIFQVISGHTKEEIVFQKNTLGYITGRARKIGEWISGAGKFQPNGWLPSPNTEVVKICDTVGSVDDLAVGVFPGSKYSVGIADMDSLVTHNTAILGILGVGKSMLAIEIIERMLASEIKVVVLDLTNQYQNELADFLDIGYEMAMIKKIQDAGQKDRDKWNESPSEGGSLQHFVTTLREDLSDLLSNDKKRNLKIYNPSQLFATKQRDEPKTYQVSGQWQRRANLYALTPVEVTQIVSETILDLVSAEMTDKAQICLVLEEAHSLVPEFSSVVADSDKYATNGTARAILQGRKYGFGCLLITQRTANVTKTILNQCNNIFAMRTFDDTGKGFLANYIGEDYSNILPTIPVRHAVFFGKASSCENPVLLKLNDQKDFRDRFRAKHAVVTPEVVECEKGPVVESDFVDDVP
jgi:hypothetical protein